MKFESGVVKSDSQWTTAIIETAPSTHGIPVDGRTQIRIVAPSHHDAVLLRNHILKALNAEG